MKPKKLALHWKIVIGLVLGAAVGLVVNLRGAQIMEAVGTEGVDAAVVSALVGLNKLAGDLFIRALKFIAVPIVLFSLALAVGSVADLRKLGRLGAKTIGIFLFTASSAVMIGLLLANLVRPGTLVPAETREELAAARAAEAATRIEAAESVSGWQYVTELIPTNPFDSLARGDMLQVVVLALLLGLGLTLIPKEKAAPVVALCDVMTDAIVALVNVIMRFAPVAVFALMASSVAAMGLDVLKALLAYSLVVVAGLLLVALAVYPAVVRLFSPVGYGRFFRGIAPAQLVAFSTSSSAATLPVTLECVTERLGVPERTAGFVCSLGVTINMDGTALYQGVAAVFIAQLYGMELSLAQQVTIVLMATLASIGTPGIPAAGIVMLVIVLESVNVPAEGIAVILGVDRLLDMCRTVVNVTGDAAISLAVAGTEGELVPAAQAGPRGEA